MNSLSRCRSVQTFLPIALAIGLTALLVRVQAAEARLKADELFQTERVIDVKIELPAKDWDALTRQTRGFSSGFMNPNREVFTDFKADITIDGVTIKEVAIRKKGFLGSLDGVRPSLKVTFDEYVDQDPIQGIDRLTLNNNRQDTSQISQYLTYRTFRKGGIHAPRVGFARVTVNGEPLGVYSNVETVRKPFLKAAFGDGSGDLYEGTLSDLYPKAIDRIEAKGKSGDPKKLLPLAELLATEGDLDMARLNELVDVPYFLKFLAIESLIGFWDGYGNNQNNYFMYRHPGSGKYMFVPWGADGAFDSGNGMMRGMANIDSSAVYANGMLANRLFWAGDTADRYTAIMQELLAHQWDEKDLLMEINRIEKLVAPHLHDNQTGFVESLAQVRQFIQSRPGQIKRIMAAGWGNVPKTPRKPMYTVRVGEASGTFATTWSNATGPDVSDEGKLEFQLMLDGEKVAFTSTQSGAGPMAFGGFGRRGRGPRGQAGEQPPPPASIRLSGVRQSDNETITLSLTIENDRFAGAAGAEIEVEGFLQQGRGGPGFGFGGRGGGMRVVMGKVKLETAGKIDGAPIAGSFNLEIVESRGGMFSRR